MGCCLKPSPPQEIEIYKAQDDKKPQNTRDSFSSSTSSKQ